MTLVKPGVVWALCGFTFVGSKIHLYYYYYFINLLLQDALIGKHQ